MSSILVYFNEHVKHRPGNIAISCGNEVYTYNKLNNEANLLAAMLLQSGVKKGDVVAILLNRSCYILSAIVSVLKCGAAYLPIDPQYPQERINTITGDADVKFIITHTGVKKVADKASYIFIEDINAVQTAPQVNVDVDENDPAYIIYTSGSTGRPKGALVTHGNLLHFVKGMQHVFAFTRQDKFLSVTSVAFDASGVDYYMALYNGAAIVLANDEDVKNGEGLHSLIQQKKVTVTNSTAATYRLMLESGWDKKYAVTAMVGGEALQPAFAHELLKRCNRLFNVYGPTEATIIATIKEIHPGEKITIGKPLLNTPVYLLDDNKNRVPVNTPGEIYIGGKAVAKGYLNRQELTASVFLHDPFSNEPNARMYKTGDLGMWNSNDDIEFLGRADNQVKINGHRIEPGEIESFLMVQPQVKEAVVIPVGDDVSAKKLTAYIVPATRDNDNEVIQELKQKIVASLPEFMVPDHFVLLNSFPVNANGKIDLKALPKPKNERPQSNLYKKPGTVTEGNIINAWQQVLQVDKLGIDDNFFESGGSSLLAQRAVNAIKEQFGYKLPVSKIYQYPTASGLASFLDAGEILQPGEVTSGNHQNKDIAVIGMECNFPGADTIAAFWNVLKEGRETVTFFADEEIDPSVPVSEKYNRDYVKARGVLKDVDLFDAAFFNINPKVAELMDPQHRLFLEVSRNLLEKTGYLPEKKKCITSVFAGCGNNTYYTNNVIWHPAKIEALGSVVVNTITDKDYVNTRTSYQLNLSGPSVNVNTACSTSLLAIAQAVESLRAGQCNIAIAGGAAIHVPVNSGHLYEEGAIFSADGHCRPFDAEAKGTMFGDGVGAVLLKPLNDAQRDGDTIYAVIKGVGVNNDGGGKGSFTAPSAEGQAGAIKMAIADAAVQPSQISYIEAHGTATPLGDPIEIDGLNLAFGEQGKKQYCAIGSVKSNMGHLTHAAGVAGFIKTALSLYHGQLPPSVNYIAPNPHIDFAASPFIVNDKLTNWNVPGRVAGISSFGVGGTNVHVILGEGEQKPMHTLNNDTPVLVNWSAMNAVSEGMYADKLKQYVASQPGINLQSLSYTLQATRKEFAVRNFVVAKDADDLVNKLNDGAKLRSTSVTLTEKNNNIVFLFPGQGSQYLNMGKGLYNSEPVFKKCVDECAALIEHEIKEDIRGVIFSDSDTTESETLKNTYYTQPAIFTISYALASLYISKGIKPAAMVGHSIGEFVAAHLAGIFSLADAIKIITSRAKLISSLPGGAMLSVRAPLNEIKEILPQDVSVAANNAPQLCVLSGEDGLIKTVSDLLNQKGVQNKLLRTSHAFHSQMMGPIIAPLKDVVQSVQLNTPQIPVASSVTGKWLTSAEAADPFYWAQHSRACVDFSAALQFVEDEISPVYIEAGPGNSTTLLAKQHGACINPKAFYSIHSSISPAGEAIAFKEAIGKLWQQGCDIDWKKLYTQPLPRIDHDVPTYAFNKKRYWVDAPSKNVAANGQPAAVVRIPLTKEVSATEKQPPVMKRKDSLIEKINSIIESASGIDINDANPLSNFMELGLDSLLLTQIASIIKKEFNVPVSFRQLNEELNSVDQLAQYLDANLSENEFVTNVPADIIPMNAETIIPVTQDAQNAGSLEFITQQLNLLTQQIAMLTKNGNAIQPQSPAKAADTTISAMQQLSAEERTELKKPFGATAKIERSVSGITKAQQEYLDNFIKAYNLKTSNSKQYTQKHRSYMADPRVVSGFRPLTKEMVYSLVINKSKGCYLWDIDGNEYVDALNGFGSNFLGYQADVLKKSLLEQIEKGYEIGPQHELAGEVSKLVCELTGAERAGLCNTGSEAVLGAMRIARTVTNKDLIVAFSGSYHGINDEVLVRGTKKLKTFAAAPGILHSNVQNMLILDYGTTEALQIIKERLNEIAAVLVEPVQSRRPEFVPADFLRELRNITEGQNTALIFDEVVTGFRSHPGGVQALLGIKPDISTYGKVAGGGFSIGIIAGSKKYMDALDGGYWQYEDDSVPEAGVTYFAGTFVRHPLTLATTHASLQYLKQQGPQLQQTLNEKTTRLSKKLNTVCRNFRIPVCVAQFSSLWKIKYHNEYPYSELLFALMRYRNIHIWDGFPCYLTTAHTDADIDKIARAFEESVEELCRAGFIPQQGKADDEEIKIVNADEPPVAGARLGRDKDGNPAWFVEDAANAGSFMLLDAYN